MAIKKKLVHGEGRQALLLLSLLIMVACLVLGGILILQKEQGGFFPGMGRVLGILLIAAGNLVSWLLNLAVWWHRRARGLGIVVAIQSLPALFLAGWLALMAMSALLDGRSSDQRKRIHAAILADDVVALQDSLEKCGRRCRENLSHQRSLIWAAKHGSLDVAHFLVGLGATPYRDGMGAIEFNDAHISVMTCEGSYLSGMTALDLAVANGDLPMLELLWPLSEDSVRLNALQTAARLDRIEMVRVIIDRQPALLQMGNWRHETLLQAAASGAALNVGRWLLEGRSSIASREAVQMALANVLMFGAETSMTRVPEFARMLQQHGAQVQGVELFGRPALEYAVETRSAALVKLLLSLGADPDRLSANQAAELQRVQESSASVPRSRQPRQGCIPVSMH